MGLRDILNFVKNNKKVQVAIVVGVLVVTWYFWTTFGTQDKKEAISIPEIVEQWKSNCPEECTNENKNDFLRFWRGSAISLITLERNEIDFKPLDRPAASASLEGVPKLVSEFLAPHIKGAQISEVSSRVIKNIGVGNMIDYILSKGELPSAQQPHFVILCIEKGSASSVRVVSNAFIGIAKGMGPNKYSETRLRMASSNLLYGDVSFIVSQIPTKHEVIHDVLNEDIRAKYFQTVVNEEIAYGEYSKQYVH